MSLLEEIVTRCTEIEQHLQTLGASGSGLSELVESVEERIRPETRREIRAIASIRNRFVHEHGYVYTDSPRDLLLSADKVLAELRTQVGANYYCQKPAFARDPHWCTRRRFSTGANYANV